jgi:hypothetical protein
MGQHTNTPSSSFPWKELLTLLGVVITAYIGYLGIRSQTELPIQATQTAQARKITDPQIISTTPSGNSNETIPTFTPTNTLVPTPTPKIFLHQYGSISLGWGNQWNFSTDTSPIRINVKLNKPPNTCQIEVALVDRDSKKVSFRESILYSESNYFSYVTVTPYGNYTVVVSVSKPNSKPNCPESEKYSFEITISP